MAAKLDYTVAGDPEGFGSKQEQLRIRNQYLNPLLSTVFSRDQTAMLTLLDELPSCDVEPLFSLAVLHNVLALILDAWKGLPRDQQDRLAVVKRVLVKHESRMFVAGEIHRARMQWLERIALALDEAGVISVSLKGHALGQRLWGDMGKRVSSDIDFLIVIEDMTAATTGLASLGYRPLVPRLNAWSKWRYPDAKFLPSADGAPILELHWLAAYGFGSRSQTRSLIASAREYQFDSGPKVRVLDPYDEFVMLSIHGAKHQFERAFWLCDLALYLEQERFSPSLLKQRAARYCAVNVLRYTMQQLRTQLGIDVSDYQQALGGKRTAALALWLERAILTRPIWAIRTKLLRIVFNLTLASGWRGRLNYLSERVMAALSRVLPG